LPDVDYCLDELAELVLGQVLKNPDADRGPHQLQRLGGLSRHLTAEVISRPHHLRGH
jgi:hypothetical protein